MIVSTTDVKCPHCGEKTPVSLGEIMDKGQLDVPCRHCEVAFTLDGTQAKAVLDDLNESLGKFAGWVKVWRDF